MRCSICGKQIPNGTICDDCYNEAMNEKSNGSFNKNINFEKKSISSKDGNLLIKITRKFLPKYQIFESWELIAFSILVVLASITYRRISFFIFALLIDWLLIAGTFLIKKRIAIGTKCYFYEDKIVYKFDFLFIHRKIVYKYSDIQDIVYNQKFVQKKFGMGNIAIACKKTGFLYKGVVIENVANVEETFKKLVKLVGTKIV